MGHITSHALPVVTQPQKFKPSKITNHMVYVIISVKTPHARMQNLAYFSMFEIS